MSANPTTSAPVLKMRRVFDAPREHVFRAWTEPELMQQWYCPNPSWRIEAQTLPVVAGDWRVAMIPPDGDANLVGGTYREFVPPSRIVFTWQWSAEEPTNIMLVTVELNALADDKTELLLTHEQFADATQMEMHEMGWNGCFGRLTFVDSA